MCHKLRPQEAEELRSEINRVLKCSHPPRLKISKVEYKAVQQLKKKIKAGSSQQMVVMERKDYLGKAMNLLEQSAYMELTLDPTSKYKAKLITMLKRIIKNWGSVTTYTNTCIQ